jgi:hypothetical protein
MSSFNFDSDKAIAAILYIVERLNNKDMHAVFKTMYIADKTHLARYGRPIIGDQYIAMENGPVPSNIYDWCKDSRKNDQPFKGFFHLKGKSYFIDILKKPDLDEFSPSDLECLNEAIEIIKPLNYNQRKKISHDDAYNKSIINGEINVIKIASAGGADEEMLNYIKEKLDFINILC